MTIVPSLYSTLAAVGIGAALMGTGLVVGNVHGQHKAELACADQRVDATAKAAKEWQEAAAAQTHLDASARAADREAMAAAAKSAQETADRFAAMKVSIVKLNPPGECTLSPEWIRAFQEAR